MKRKCLWQKNLLNARGERLDSPLFFNYNKAVSTNKMDKDNLKLIVRNLESLVQCLKSEIYSDTDAYKPTYEQIAPHLSDYDEVFYDGDDDGYPD